MWDTTIEGITFDFGSTNNGIILQNGVFNNTFDIVIQNCGTGTALTLSGGSTAGQSVLANIFKRLFIFNAGKGIRFLATSPQVASNNYFDYVFENNITSIGVEFVNQADTNHFNFLFQSLNNSNANGVSFNTGTPGSDTGANDNKIVTLIQNSNGASYVGTLVTINKSSGNQIFSWSVGGGLSNGTELAVTNNPSYSVTYAVDFTNAANNNTTLTGGMKVSAYGTNFPLLLNNPGGGTSGMAIQSGGVTKSSIQDNLSTHNLEFYDASNTLLFQMLQGGGVGVPTYADVTEVAAPASPAAGKQRWYADSTAHTLSCLRNGGISCVPGGLPVGTIVSGSDISFPGNARVNGPDPHWDITAFCASGSTQSTTATATAGLTAVTLAAAIDFKNCQYIHIAGAGASSLPYFGQIVSGAGTVNLIVSPAIGTTVAGATASHDDIPAINAAIDACTAFAIASGNNNNQGGGPIFFPAGIFQQKSQPVHHHSPACQLTGPAGTKVAADLAMWNGANGYYGPTLVSTGGTSASSYMSVASFPTALLTGTGTAFALNGNNGVFDLRDCKTCAELNGLTAVTLEGTFNFSSFTATNMGLICSSGKRDSVQGQQTAACLWVNSSNQAVCTINVAGTARTVTDTVALTTGSNIDLVCDYDHANVRLFKNGTSVGTPVAVVGAIVQAPLEGVLIGSALGDFPDNFSNNQSISIANNVTVDGIRVSDVARYTSNFTAPTAKWTLGQLDINTKAQCDFDSQPDIFTVCYTSANLGSSPYPAYLPYHRAGFCPGGVDSFHVSNMSFGDGSGRDQDGIYFNGGSGWVLENIAFNTNHNGILTDSCDYDYHGKDLQLAGQGSARYLMGLSGGIGQFDNIHASGSSVALVLPGNGVYNHIFLSPSGLNGPDLVSILVKAAGAATLEGAKPYVMINDVQSDIEAAITSSYCCVLMLDQIFGAQLNVGNYTDALANATAIGIQVNGGGAIQINGAAIVSAAGQPLIHVASAPSSPIMLNGIQNPQNLALTDGGTTIVCGGTGTGSVSGCSMPTYSTSTNCAVNSASPAACGSSAAGAFVVPTTTTTYTVNTTAVLGTTSRIFLTPITFAANLPSSPTCVAPAAGAVTISAVVANTSFTFTLPSTAGQTCWQYHIMN